MKRLFSSLTSIVLVGMTLAQFACSRLEPSAPMPIAKPTAVQSDEGYTPLASAEVSHLRLAEMCSTAARQFWKDGEYDKQHHKDQLWGYSSHYNRRLRRCLIKTTLTTLSRENGGAVESVSDAFEGIDIATASHVNRGETSVMGDDVLSGASDQAPHTSEWFKRLMVE